MQWDPETMDWELWLPFISPLACRVWPWLLSIPGPGKGQVRLSEPGHSPLLEQEGAEGPPVAVPPPWACGEPHGQVPRQADVWSQA